jgi:hypothetical protein
MAIASLDNYIASAKQTLYWMKTASRTSVAAIPFSVFDLAGQPGAGTLAGASTTAGIVPDDTVAGYPSINAYGGGNTGYLTRVNYFGSVAENLWLYDRLFLAGAYSFNASQTLSAQPSYSARIPNADYTGTQIWIETVTTFTGNLSIAVTYTNQSGTTGRTTGTIATGVAPTIGRCINLPLQAGDTGVQKIESVTATVATVGTFNVMVLRPLWVNRVTVANAGDVNDLLRTGMPQVPATAALYVLVQPDSTATGLTNALIEIANG